MSPAQTRAHERERGEGRHHGGEGNQGKQDERGDPAAVTPAASDPQARGDVGGKVEREAAGQANCRNDLERLVDVGERRLHAEREQDDPGDHRQVEVRVQVARQHRSLFARRVGQPGLVDVDGPVEVRPPEGGGDDDSEDRGRDPGGVEWQAFRADPDGDDRLSDGDDHDQPVALHEVLRRDPPATHAGHDEPQVVDRQCGGPDGHLYGAVQEPGDHQQGRADEGARQDPHDGAEELWIAAAGERVEDEMEGAHDEVRDAEDNPIRLEGVRRGQRDDEHRGHRSEHGDSDSALLRVQRVGEPGVCRPRPPEDAEEEEAAQQAIPRRVVGEEAGDLGDGEDEDEIEEELKRRHSLLGLGLSVPHHGGPWHARSLPSIVARWPVGQAVVSLGQ